jgi:hypothetical protein
MSLKKRGRKSLVGWTSKTWEYEVKKYEVFSLLTHPVISKGIVKVRLTIEEL